MASFFDSFTEMDSTDVDNREPPPQKFVDWLHGKVSTRRPTDIHHRIGFGPTEVSQGNHNHDGKNSVALWRKSELPATLPPSATNAQLADAINKLTTMLDQKSAE